MKAAYDLARAELGTVEWAEGSNPKVVAYYRDAGHPEVKDDAVAWCAAFVGAMLVRAGIRPSGVLTARSYLNWGVAVAVADVRQGDIGVIPRGNSAWQGHVFFIDRIERGKVYALGGNQRDSVSLTTYPSASLLGVRRAGPGDVLAAGPRPVVPIAARPVTPKPVDDSPTPDTGGKGFWAWLFALFAKKGDRK